MFLTKRTQIGLSLAFSLLAHSAHSSPEPEIDPATIDMETVEEFTLFPGTSSEVQFLLPRTAISADEILFVYNSKLDTNSNPVDPVSVYLKDEYVPARGIPSANVLAVEFDPVAQMPLTDFGPIKAALEVALTGRDDIQAIVLAWTAPWQIKDTGQSEDKVSVCSYVSGYPVGAAYNGYIGSTSTRPWTDFGFRPVMMLAADTQAAADTLTDAVGAIDNSFPLGDGYMIRTSDTGRSDNFFSQMEDAAALFEGTMFELSYLPWQGGLNISADDTYNLALLIAAGDHLVNTEDILYYFTGMATVPEIGTNDFLPGSFAQNVTSGSGRLTERETDFFECTDDCPTLYYETQMSALEWLENGAAGSYGNAVEPRAFQSRFVNPALFIPSYTLGATMIEAMWKSVEDPIFGVFVGDPLARPYGFRPVSGQNRFETTSLKPGLVYSLYTKESTEERFQLHESNITVSDFVVSELTYPFDAPIVYVLEEHSKAGFKAIHNGETALTCGFEIDGIEFWCLVDATRSELWMQRPDSAPLTLTTSLANSSATKHGDSVFWQQFAAGGGFTTHEYDTISTNTASFFPRPATDVKPAFLKVSDASIVWTEAPTESQDGIVESLLRYDRTTNNITDVAGPGLAVTMPEFSPARLDLDGDRLVFTGFDSSIPVANAYEAVGASPPTNLELAGTLPGSFTSSVAADGGYLVRRDGGTALKLRDTLNNEEQLPNHFNLTGGVGSLDFYDGKVLAIYGDAGERHFLLYDIARETSVLLQSPPGNEFIGLNNKENYSAAHFFPGSLVGAASIQLESVPKNLLRYDLDIAEALDSSVQNRVVAQGETAGIYIRPSEEYYADGQLTYEIEMADGSSLDAGIGFQVVPAGDVNFDGNVNGFDIGLIQQLFFSNDTAADFDNDGAVNFFDLAIAKLNYFNLANLNFAYVTWDSSQSTNTAVEVLVTMTINDTASFRKVLEFSVQ